MRKKTPPKEILDIRDPAIFAKLFEEENRDQILYFTKVTMDGFFDLLDDLEYIH